MYIIIIIIIIIRERCYLVREGKMFIKDEAEISSRVRGVVYFGKYVFLSPTSKNYVLEELRVRGLAVIQEEMC